MEINLVLLPGLTVPFVLEVIVVLLMLQKSVLAWRGPARIGLGGWLEAVKVHCPCSE